MGNDKSDRGFSNKVFIYLIYDRETDAYQNFKMFRNDAVAIRYLDNLINNPTSEQKEYQSYLVRYAHCLDLVRIGEFSNDNGKIFGYDKSEIVVPLSKFTENNG